MGAGGLFPCHVHSQVETIITYKGTGFLDVCGAKIPVFPGSVSVIHPNEEHSLLATTDLEVLVVVVPDEESFPDAATC